MEHVVAVIMAGGSGTRFWPLSRRLTPKQLLPLVDPTRTLIASTLERIAPIVPGSRTLIVTGEHLADATQRAAPSVPAANILCEPIARNTAPCVAWAAYHAHARDPEAVLAVLAADHHVEDRPGYLRVLEAAIEEAASGALVTIGIRPTRPETGYGYIEVGERTRHGHVVKRFVEKPSLAVARGFLETGAFLWNSGQFFFRADAVIRAFEAQLPELARTFAALTHAGRTPSRGEILAAFEASQSISIDHGIMERAPSVRVVPGDFGWSDVGSWTTAWELGEKDASGNVSGATEAVFVAAERNFVRSVAGKVVALVGVEDLVVVDTPDALLVIPRERAQDVRSVVEALRAKGGGIV